MPRRRPPKPPPPPLAVAEILTWADAHRNRAGSWPTAFSWAKALRAAGIDPKLHRMPRGTWTPEGAEDWVRQRVAKRKPILARDAPSDLLNFIHRRLRVSWTDFVESLGIPYPGIKRRRDWTKRKLFEEIRRWGAEGNRLNYKAVQAERQALIHQARKFFGSWDRARAAGV
jgi:hypothetical protein